MSTYTYITGRAYKATVHGVPNMLCIARVDHFTHDDTHRGVGTTYFADATNVLGPLTLLCLEQPEATAAAIRERAGGNSDTDYLLGCIADEIEGQTEPSRTEPGWGEKVIAHTQENEERRLFLCFSSGDRWHWCDEVGTAERWLDLIDPVPVRVVGRVWREGT